MVDTADMEPGVENAARHAIDNVVGEHQAGLDLQQGKRGAQAEQQPAELDEIGVVDTGDEQAASHLALDLLGLAGKALEHAEYVLGFAEQDLARPGQGDFSRRAVEQRDADFLLDRLDVRGYRRLGQAQPFGGAGQMPQPGDHDKRAELENVHRRQFVAATEADPSGAAKRRARDGSKPTSTGVPCGCTGEQV